MGIPIASHKKYSRDLERHIRPFKRSNVSFQRRVSYYAHTRTQSLTTSQNPPHNTNPTRHRQIPPNSLQNRHHPLNEPSTLVRQENRRLDPAPRHRATRAASLPNVVFRALKPRRHSRHAYSKPLHTRDTSLAIRQPDAECSDQRE